MGVETYQGSVDIEEKCVFGFHCAAKIVKNAALGSFKNASNDAKRNDPFASLSENISYDCAAYVMPDAENGAGYGGQGVGGKMQGGK